MVLLPTPLAQSRSFGTIRPLTPAHRHVDEQVSPLSSRKLLNVPPPTTWCTPVSLFTPYLLFQRTRRVSDFAMNEQARRYTPPNRVRYPADRQFASGCSPPHLMVTQLPSATGLWLTPTRTYTVLFARLHGRTHSRVCGNPVVHYWIPGQARNDGISSVYLFHHD